VADFLHAFGHVLQMEGGYVNDPNDPGGEMKYGISRRQYPMEDIHDLTLDRAVELYGGMGPNTRNALNANRHPESLLKVLNGVQFEHYRQIVKENPDMAQYFRGWMRRMEFG